MVRDAEYFRSKIGGLDGAGDAGDYIVGLVKAKTVPKPQPPASEPLAEALTKESTTTNGKSSSDLPSDGTLDIDEKGRQEQKQVAAATGDTAV